MKDAYCEDFWEGLPVNLDDNGDAVDIEDGAGRTKEQLDLFESLCGHKLPSLYRKQFSLQNGGYPNRTIFFDPTRTMTRGHFAGYKAYGIFINDSHLAPIYDTYYSMREYLQLAWNDEEIAEELPDWQLDKLVIISFMWGHSVLCLDYGYLPGTDYEDEPQVICIETDGYTEELRVPTYELFIAGLDYDDENYDDWEPLNRQENEEDYDDADNDDEENDSGEELPVVNSEGRALYWTNLPHAYTTYLTADADGITAADTVLKIWDHTLLLSVYIILDEQLPAITVPIDAKAIEAKRKPTQTLLKTAGEWSQPLSVIDAIATMQNLAEDEDTPITTRFDIYRTLLEDDRTDIEEHLDYIKEALKLAKEIGDEKRKGYVWDDTEKYHSQVSKILEEAQGKTLAQYYRDKDKPVALTIEFRGRSYTISVE